MSQTSIPSRTTNATSVVGLRIKRARIAAGLSQEALAERLGLTNAAVAQWELGSTSPRPSRLAAIAQALAVEISFLVDRHSKANGPPGQARDDDGCNLKVDRALVAEAKLLGIDANGIAEAALRVRVQTGREERWLAENRAALESANEFLDRYGLWSDGLRMF